MAEITVEDITPAEPAIETVAEAEPVAEVAEPVREPVTIQTSQGEVTFAAAPQKRGRPLLPGCPRAKTLRKLDAALSTRTSNSFGISAMRGKAVVSHCGAGL